MDRLFKYLSCALAVLLLICAGYVISLSYGFGNMRIYNMDTKSAVDSAVVEVRGEVKKAGVYNAKKGMSIYDVLYMAGGITKTADLSMIDTDSVITKDCIIEIPCKDESSVTAVAEYDFSSDAESGKCNINTASLKQLSALHGIGAAIASRIVDYRTEIGNFKSIDEIKNVKGIGENTFSELKDYITVGGE